MNVMKYMHGNGSTKSEEGDTIERHKELYQESI